MPAVPGIVLALTELASGPLTSPERPGGGSEIITNVYIVGVCRCDRVYVEVEKLWNVSRCPPSLRIMFRRE